MIEKIRRQMLKWKRRIGRSKHTLRTQDINSALDQLNVQAGQLLVHSSLSACGKIVGGAQTVIQCLESRCKTLVLPTHTYCYPASQSDVGEVFDSRSTASQIGAISDHFWRRTGCVRSLHPSHSIAAMGMDARELCEGHEHCFTPCGQGTPYHKLVTRQASVLMFGCDLNTYTLFHTSEAYADCDYLYYPGTWKLQYRDHHNTTFQIDSKRQDMSVPRRFRQMEIELCREGLAKRQQLGSGVLLYIQSSSDLNKYLLDQLRNNPRYLVKL
jgi:aminoglycoside 3-N-acetyltransferase